MNKIVQELNEELLTVLDKVQTFIAIRKRFHQVFGADDFIKRYPTLFTTGISLCQLKDKNYYIIKDNKIVGDCAFFSQEETMQHFISSNSLNENFDHPSNLECCQ